MRKAVTIFALLALMAGADYAYAGWYIHCTNDSCHAERGGVVVEWAEEWDGERDWVYLTGVKGLPIRLTDFETAEKNVTATMSKTLAKRKSSATDMTVDTPETGGPSASIAGSKEKLLQKQQVITASRGRGERAEIDHTLNFIRWWGDALEHSMSLDRLFSGEEDRGFDKYLLAAEVIMHAYENQYLKTLIELYFAINNFDVLSIPLTPERHDRLGRLLQLIKHFSLTSIGWHNTNLQANLQSAVGWIYKFYTFSEKQMKDIIASYRDDMQTIKQIVQAKTPLQLYSIDKQLAFVKYLTFTLEDIKGDEELSNSWREAQRLDIRDRYLLMLGIVRFQEKLDPETNERSRFFHEMREKFEKEIRERHPNVLLTKPVAFTKRR